MSNSFKSCKVRSNSLKSCKVRSNSLKSCKVRSDSLKSCKVRSNSLKLWKVRSNSLKSYKVKSNLWKSRQFDQNLPCRVAGAVFRDARSSWALIILVFPLASEGGGGFHIVVDDRVDIPRADVDRACSFRQSGIVGRRLWLQMALGRGFAVLASPARIFTCPRSGRAEFQLWWGPLRKQSDVRGVVGLTF